MNASLARLRSPIVTLTTVVTLCVGIVTASDQAQIDWCSGTKPSNLVACVTNPVTCESFNDNTVVCNQQVGIYDVANMYTVCAPGAVTDDCDAHIMNCSQKYNCGPDDWDWDDNCEKAAATGNWVTVFTLWNDACTLPMTVQPTNPTQPGFPQ
jgi:hypothetical protein